MEYEDALLKWNIEGAHRHNIKEDKKTHRELALATELIFCDFHMSNRQKPLIMESFGFCFSLAYVSLILTLAEQYRAPRIVDWP